ncbi:MAG: hypothetical protein CHACPFDD_01071 [Phycisphaerae bacterium]|nr:hypothetical protein [Phycisphaerae bacterium]
MRCFSRLCMLVVIGALAAPALSQSTANRSRPWRTGYDDGRRWVALFPDPTTLEVVLKPEFAENPPADLLRECIEVDGAYLLLKPQDVELSRGAYIQRGDVRAVHSVFYRTEDAFRQRAAAQRMTLTNRIAVRLHPSATIEDLLAASDVTLDRTIPYCERTYIVLASSDDHALAVAQSILSTGLAEWAVPQFKRRYPRRHIPNDPMFGQQWHLRNTGQGSGRAGVDIHATDAWDVSRGAGATIGVVDDGLDWTHPDLFANYRPEWSWDINAKDPDPMPFCTHAHGTAVAGLAAAVGNNALGVSGVAPAANLAGIRLIAEPVTDEEIGDALSHQAQHIDIYNCSWGVVDDGETIDGPGVLAAAALDDGVRTGRGGLGNIFVWAAGNGRITGDDANFDGFANARHTIAVAACDNLDRAAAYSEGGACILLNAPSSGGTLALATTDPTGVCGDDPGDYRTDFGFTSGAAPLVSGVIALMLERNPLLDWRDVQTILVRSAVPNQTGDGGWRTNAGGRMYHPALGFGRVNAAEALRLTDEWVGLGDELLYTQGFALNRAIPDNNVTGVKFNMTVPGGLFIERVEVALSVIHPRRGDIEITVTSPAGTQSVVAPPRLFDSNADFDWTFVTVHFWDEDSEGTWRVTVRDTRQGAVGSIVRFGFTVFGHDALANSGDMNGDGAFNGFDIDGFLLALADRAAYHALYPHLDPDVIGDLNNDGVLDVFDLPAFVKLTLR